MNLNFDNLMAELEKNQFFDPAKLEGCNPEQLRALSDAAPGVLPEVYLRLMAMVGFKGGDVLDEPGIKFCFPGILEASKKIRDENLMRFSKLDLPPKSFIFFVSDLYEFSTLSFGSASG